MRRKGQKLTPIVPGLFAFDSGRKRFFSETDCRGMLSKGWDLQTLLPLEEQRYDRLKRLWAASARKTH